jgi:hypothetical protein
MTYDISAFYPHIYLEKFKQRRLLQIDSGWILSNMNVYLQLDDIDILNDLGHMLDFYRKINTEGSTLRIKLMNNYTICNHVNTEYFCSDCNIYFCFDCKLPHEGHNVLNKCVNKKNSQSCNMCEIQNSEPLINEICINCYTANNELKGKIEYSRPVINRFNLYEWIPIHGYLENRNVNSHLYKRLLNIEYNNDCIELELVDEFARDYNLENIKLLNVMYRILNIYNVPLTLREDIIDKTINYSSINYSSINYSSNKQLIISY